MEPVLYGATVSKTSRWPRYPGRVMTTPSPGRREAETAKRSIHFRIDGGADDRGVPIKVDLRPGLQRSTAYRSGTPIRAAADVL